MATPNCKNIQLHSPAGFEDAIYTWPLQSGSGSDTHDNGIDIIETIRFVCEDIPEIRSTFEEINFAELDTACYKTMTSFVDRFNKAIDSILNLEKGTSLPTQRLNKFASPSLLRHILQLVYNAAVIDPDKLNQYEPFSPEVYGETSYDLIHQMIKHVSVTAEDTFIDLGSGVGQVVLQMAGSFPLKSCIGIEKAEVPSRYAEQMDIHFRFWMRWFGKRFGDYQLLKGDFLVDEHREKITSSSLVFVNNFAFGPHVDHQLKERFADLKDGARIVSSKSFCPLNFRITDRNLSDIGTIMHVSEMTPLKGSVSWTGKPVSYYLHSIDRTKLERYFQRLKSQKASDESFGTTRTTRERSKRSAANNNNNHSTTNNSNSNTSSSSPIEIETSSASNLVNDTQNLDIDTSSESETGEVHGPTTRRAWSDWCSSKEKSSQSDDEENNNLSTNSLRNNIKLRVKTQIQKKRKKLTRKTASNINNKSNSNNTNNDKIRAAVVVTNIDKKANVVTIRRGRMKKGRGKRSIKIAGLDILHNRTLLSTSAEAMSKKLPPAPGTVDQKLTSLSGNMCHAELDIPVQPSDTPYGLQILLDNFKSQYMSLVDQMKSREYKENINKEIQKEKERKEALKNRINQLDKQIKVLIEDSVNLLKIRMNELGISMTSQNDLLAKAKEIVGRHKELQVMAAKLQSQNLIYEKERDNLVKKNLQVLCGTSKIKISDLSEMSAGTHELVLKEIANTLAIRKKLQIQANNLEENLILMEKINEEKKNAALILAQQSPHLTVTNVTLNVSQDRTNATSKSTSFTKSSRKNREHRTRSQEWPDIPDIGKIEENNPEILAQKILETGRKIEAGKLMSNTGRHLKDERKHTREFHEDSTLMPAPQVNVKSNSVSIQPTQQVQPRVGRNTSNSSQSIVVTPVAPQQQQSMSYQQQQSHSNSKLTQESPKVVNFEDRLKSIITSALNEDNEQRKAGTQVDRKPVMTVAPQQHQPQQHQPQQHQPQQHQAQQHPPQQHTPQQHTPQQHPPQQLPPQQQQQQTQQQQQQLTQQKQLSQHQQHPQQQSLQQVQLNATTYNPSNKHHLSSSQSQQPHNINTILNVATQGLTHLNSTTTISPVTPSPPGTYNLQQQSPVSGGFQHRDITQYKSSTSYNPIKHQGQNIPPNNIQKLYNKNLNINISPNTSNPINSSHSQSSHPLHSPSTAVIFPGHQPQHQIVGDLMYKTNLDHPDRLNRLEFKTPEHMRYDKLNCPPQEEIIRSHSASSDSAIYYPPSRDRIISTGSANSILQNQPPSRPSSNSSQPDYTQVSPAKMALRRHLSQEKLSQQQPASYSSGMSKTIGDLVNGEIERTLEISHQSIINAAINMSSVGTPPERTMLINTNVQRPERVNVRILEDAYGNPIPHIQHRAGHEYGAKSPTHHTNSNISISHETSRGINYRTTNVPQQQPLVNVATRNHQHQPAQNSLRTSFNNGMYVQQPQNNINRLEKDRNERNYVSVALPRSELKPCIESYFKEEQKNTIEHEARPMRMMNGNPPLEGLAASLQARVIASLRIKEEAEERQRKSDQMNYNCTNPSPIFQPAQIKTEVGIKRTSPTVLHHKPLKIRHFSERCNLPPNSTSDRINSIHSDRITESPLMSPEINSITPDCNENRTTINLHARSLTTATVRTEDDDVIPDDETGWQDRVSSGFDRLVAFASTELDKTRRSIDNDTIPSPDSGIANTSNSGSDARTFLSTSSTSSTTSQLDIPLQIQQENKRNMININDNLNNYNMNININNNKNNNDNNNNNSNSNNNNDIDFNKNDNKNITNNNNNINDSSNINNNNNNNTNNNENNNNNGNKNNNENNNNIYNYSNNNNKNNSNDNNNNITLNNINDSSSNNNNNNNDNVNNNNSNSNTNTNNNNNNNNNIYNERHHEKNSNFMLSKKLKLSSSLNHCKLNIDSITPTPPIEQDTESPPLSEVGVPRTPSPTATPPPLGSITSTLYSGSMSTTVNQQPTLKIPLKYQRQSRISSEKHYKKKFRERTWEYDIDVLFDMGENPSVNDNSVQQEQQQQQQKTQISQINNITENSNSQNSDGSNNQKDIAMPAHKASKFRPKGKDWSKMNHEENVVN